MNELRPNRIQVFCPNCGQRLWVDPARPSAVCPFCGDIFPARAAALAPEAQPPIPAGKARRRGASYDRRDGEKPRRRRRPFLRFLLTCAVLLLLGRTVLPVLSLWLRNGPRAETDRRHYYASATSRPTLTPKPAATSRPAAAVQPAATSEPAAAPQYTSAPSPGDAPRTELSGVTPVFRAAMDSYEAIFDEYIAFMNDIGEEDNGFAFLLRYAEMLERYEDAMEAMDAIDEDSLSAADERYYLEVLSRINMKLLAASED